MKKIVERKFNELKQIIVSFENYKGGAENQLTAEVKKLKNKLTSEEFNVLNIAIDCYKDYICRIFAETKRVFISLKDNKLSSLENIFESIE